MAKGVVITKEMKEQAYADRRTVKLTKQEILDNSRKNLKKEIEIRANQILAEVENAYIMLQQKKNDKDRKLKYSTGLTSAKVASAIRNPYLRYGSNQKYTAEELYTIFEQYVRVVDKVNDFEKYIPCKESFSAFAGFSTSTYDRYTTSSDADTRDVMEVIEDYIKEVQLSSAQKKEISEGITEFRMKAEHGMIERQPIQIKAPDKQVNYQEIENQIGNLFKRIDIKEATTAETDSAPRIEVDINE